MPRPLRIIGLMSGTSADGIDAALCEISGEPPQIQADLLSTVAYAYPAGFQQHIHEQAAPETARLDQITQLHFDLGEHFAAAAREVTHHAGFGLENIDLIAMHGQTIWHQVSQAGQATATFQIGEPAVVAELTGVTTISNFRARDVAAGGQGAPLTSYVDWLLLRHPSHWRAVQNIGGIANVTLLPPLTETHTAPIAFDTGPGNALIDGLVFRLTGGTQTYDGAGAMAAGGRIDEGLMETLRERDMGYYQQPPPKTTGRERYNPALMDMIIEYGRAAGLAPEDIVATTTLLTATTIAEAYQQFAPVMPAELIVGGGGARNATLMRTLQMLIPETRVKTHEDIGMDSDFKEALVFAVLGYETWYARPSTLPAFTGARHPSVLGSITPGANYLNLLRDTEHR